MVLPGQRAPLGRRPLFLGDPRAATQRDREAVALLHGDRELGDELAGRNVHGVPRPVTRPQRELRRAALVAWRPALDPEPLRRPIRLDLTPALGGQFCIAAGSLSSSFRQFGCMGRCSFHGWSLVVGVRLAGWDCQIRPPRSPRRLSDIYDLANMVAHVCKRTK